MIAKVNQHFIPFLANGDADDMTGSEIEACTKFMEENLPHGFSVYDVDSEWITDFNTCDICGELAQVVFIYTDPEDRDDLHSMFFAVSGE